MFFTTENKFLKMKLFKEIKIETLQIHGPVNIKVATLQINPQI